MAPAVSLSFRASAERAEMLDKLAAATNRTKSWLLEQALAAYLEREFWQAAHIERGLEELSRGQGVPHDDVVSWLTSWGSEHETDPPA